MKTNVTTIRRNLVPATLSCTIYAKSASGDEEKGYGTKQVHYASTDTYVPNRDEDHYLILQPVVNAFTKDGSIGNNGEAVNVNANLVSMKWVYSNDLNTPVKDWTQLTADNDAGLTFEFDDDSTDSTRGNLKIMSNLAEGTTLYLSFIATFSDPRASSLSMIVTSNPVMLSCIQNDSLDQYKIYTEDNTNILYNPLEYTKDDTGCMRVLKFYLVKGGQRINFPYYDEGGRSKLFHIVIYKGSSLTSSNIVTDSAGTWFSRQKGDGSNGFISNIGYESIIDEDGNEESFIYLRLFVGYSYNDGNYTIALVGPDPNGGAGTFTYDTIPLSIHRNTPAINVTNVNKSPFVAGQIRLDKCIASVNGAKIDYPSYCYVINWGFQNMSGTDITRDVEVTETDTNGSVSIKFPDDYDQEGFGQWFEVQPGNQVGTVVNNIELYSDSGCTTKLSASGSYTDIYMKVNEDIHLGGIKKINVDSRNYTKDDEYFLEFENTGTNIVATYLGAFTGTITPSTANVLSKGVYKLSSSTATSVAVYLATSTKSMITNFL